MDYSDRSLLHYVCVLAYPKICNSLSEQEFRALNVSCKSETLELTESSSSVFVCFYYTLLTFIICWPYIILHQPIQIYWHRYKLCINSRCVLQLFDESRENRYNRLPMVLYVFFERKTHQHLWNIAIQPQVGSHNVWPSARCSRCSPPGEKSLWNRTIMKKSCLLGSWVLVKPGVFCRIEVAAIVLNSYQNF